jgi:hypothetical protein
VAQFGEGKLELREELPLAPPRNTLATKAPPGLRNLPGDTECRLGGRRLDQLRGQ